MSQTAFEPRSDPEDDANPDIARLFLLTDGDVLVRDEGSDLWRSVAAEPEAESGAREAPTPAQLRALKRSHPAYQGRNRRHLSHPGGGDDGGKLEIYDPLTSSWSAVPGAAGRAKVGEAVCCVLPDGKFLIGGTASSSCATYDPRTNRWSTSPLPPTRPGSGRRNGGPASVIAVRMINQG